MIPHIIHQIWFQGWSSLPAEYNSNVESVIKFNPDWQHIKWDESGIKEVVKLLGTDAVAKYDSLKLLHQKVDFGRYAILYTYGGVSVDIDAVAFRPMDETHFLTSEDFIVSENSTGKFINNATIFLSSKNPVMKKWIDGISSECKFYMGDFGCVLQTTGPYAFTRFVRENKDGIMVLPPKYFEPCSGSDADCEPGSLAILNHKHEKTWINPVYKSVAEQYYKLKPYKHIFIIIFVLIVLFLLYKGLKK